LIRIGSLVEVHYAQQAGNIMQVSKANISASQVAHFVNSSFWALIIAWKLSSRKRSSLFSAYASVVEFGLELCALQASIKHHVDDPAKQLANLTEDVRACCVQSCSAPCAGEDGGQSLHARNSTSAGSAE